MQKQEYSFIILSIISFEKCVTTFMIVQSGLETNHPQPCFIYHSVGGAVTLSPNPDP